VYEKEVEEGNEVKEVKEVEEVKDRKLLVGRNGREAPLTGLGGIDRLGYRDGVCLLAGN
jgi:hypothetical protein